MKRNIYFSIVMIAAMLLLSSVVKAQIPQLFGFNEKDATPITIKNTSGDSANDFHLKVKPPLGYAYHGGVPPAIIKAVGFPPAAAGQDGAFNGKVFPSTHPPTYPDHADWTAADNNFMIPPGGSMKVLVWANSYDPDSTYLTRDGSRLSTNGIDIVAKIDQTGSGAGSGILTIINDEPVPVFIQTLQAHINNNNIPFDSVTYYPTGTPVPGIPNFVIINPGDSVQYPYTGNQVGGWISLHFLGARQTSPGDYYDMGALAKELEATAVPTLSEWGLIALAGLLVILGAGFIRKMV